MIEFYSKYFSKTYKAKIKSLSKDIDRIFELYNFTYKESDKNNLDFKYKNNLDEDLWKKINNQYENIKNNKSNLSLLKKFINKDKTDSKKPRLIDTFAGSGGMSLGFEKAGFSTAYVNEIDPKLLETYYFNRDLSINNYHCGDIAEFKDYLENNNFQYKNIDLIIGGPPCQGFSNANRQRIIDDPRNILYKNFISLIAESRPKFFVMENVRGMMNKSDEIMNDFKDNLGSEYKMIPLLLNAKDFNIPQNRERYFLIGTKIKNLNLEKVLSSIESNKRDPKFDLNDVIENLPKLGVKKEKNSRVENNKIGFKFAMDKINNSKYSNYINESKINIISNHTNRFNNQRDVEIFKLLPQGENSLHKSIQHIMPYKSRNKIFKDKYYKLKGDSISKTITAHMSLDCNMYIHPYEPRGLSPREAARIQTFPDDYIFMGYNNSWYTQIGNAVPVKLAKIIGESIIPYT